jgi:hypothetical protein
MSLTLADALLEVRASLNEGSAVFWGDDELTNWIQEGVRQFSSKTLLVEDTQTLTTAQLTESQIVYSSSDESWIGDCLEIYAAIYFDGTSSYKGLIKVHPRHIGNLGTFTAGDPKYYTLFNRNIYIWPPPSAAVAAAGEISFLYAKETEDITEVTDEFQQIPITYCLAKAKQKDQKFADSAALMAQFYQEVAFERQDKHDREVDTISDFKIQGGRGNAPTR